ncbi:HPP family protein [Chryseobacterium sp. Ch-15]|uniref:HPP family protein n=1 Tax=Chryseobacterium muglaense TaxID=2893752 RepID=A0A9Q3USD9_9FLAO|nr:MULTISPECIES: HPP family protein [Chryseobacterium]MBD3904028.1 HPP family protein [Chryseobacterium muglaense]MBO6185710.1 HPP family protein [Chryseobacterium sp.]MCC9032786.1 HPP family protein [Chryseobacterium muglaense]MCM2553677.1 HPP family protein [Chryseobacterium muglaense]
MKKTFKRTLRVSKYVIYKETLVDYKEHFWSFLGAFFGIGLIAFLQSHYLLEQENVFLIGSFGASSVLIYGAIQSPLAQPRNFVGGHVISALVGVTVYQIVPDILWLSAPLAVAFSIILMQYTKTLHPPGGATALIAVTSPGKIADLGYWYVLSPVLSGCLILLLVALVFNNMTKNRSYPAHSRFIKLLKKKHQHKLKN